MAWHSTLATSAADVETLTSPGSLHKQKLDASVSRVRIVGHVESEIGRRAVHDRAAMHCGSGNIEVRFSKLGADAKLVDTISALDQAAVSMVHNNEGVSHAQLFDIHREARGMMLTLEERTKAKSGMLSMQ